MAESIFDLDSLAPVNKLLNNALYSAVHLFIFISAMFAEDLFVLNALLSTFTYSFI